MYGVPRDLDLSRFVGSELIQICLGSFQVQFHFQAAGAPGSEGTLHISVEGRWELCDGSGRVVDNAEAASNHEGLYLPRLLGHSVVGTDVDAPQSILLRFITGDELRIFDDSSQFESFSIQPGDIFV